MVCYQHQVLQLTQLTNLLPETFLTFAPKSSKACRSRFSNSNIKQQQFFIIQKCNFKKFNVIDLQMNTTKVVVMTLPHYNMKDFAISWKFFSNFSQPISPSKSIFQPIWAIFRGHHTLHRIHWTQMHSTIQHPNIYSLTIMWQTKETHLSSCTQTKFSFDDTSKWSQFSSDHAPQKSHLCWHATLKFHKLSIYLEQIAYSITNHPNIILK